MLFEFENQSAVGVIGAGTMGRGIAQIAATAGNQVMLVETNPEVLQAAQTFLKKILARQVEKGRISRGEDQVILDRITFEQKISSNMAACSMVIEAIIENLAVKKEVFRSIEELVNPDTILATNTSSLSVTEIASVCKHPNRFIGLHFFNPAPLMPLVEVVPGVTTDAKTIEHANARMTNWNKWPVIAKDTPGFIVNRVARPFYGEALRILEEGISDVATIDWAMKEIGGFRMGPFELMDLIGNDVNFKVTETVWKAFFFEPRYRPTFTQQRLVQAGWLGKKSGKGYYDYHVESAVQQPKRDRSRGQAIVERILTMLINEAVDAVFWQVADAQDIDLAMTKGVNYPRGLLQWGDTIGLDVILERINVLQDEYGEDRYRASPLLKRMVRNNQKFYG